MLNKVILMGRITANPKLRKTPSNNSVATFSLAINRSYNRNIADFINIVAWRQTADFVSKYFTKGQLVVIEGTLQTTSYEDKQGNKRVGVEVVAEHVYFTGSNKNDDKLKGLTQSAPVTQNNTADEDAPIFSNEELPVDINEYQNIEDDF